MRLRHATFRDLNVQAFENVHAGTGGPVLTADEHKLLRYWRNGEVADNFDPDARFDEHLAGEWNYIGPVHHHFGHIMSEMVHRVLPSRRIFQHDRWLAVAQFGLRDTGYDALPAPYRTAIEFLGVNAENIKVINRNTVVSKLNIHEQMSQLGLAPSSEYLTELGDYTTAKLDALHGAGSGHARVYVSRTGMQRGGNILGERYIANILHEEGFTIFQPELHALSYQMDVYRKAGVLLFSEGSACHGVEFLGPVLRDVFLIQRRPEAHYIFDNALAPRSRSYQRYKHPIYVGTAAMHPFEDRPLAEWGESLVDVDQFLIFMREHAISPMTRFDADEYFAAALQDLDEYIEFHKTHGSRLVPADELNRMREMVISKSQRTDPA
jgi:hypothetical protein